MKKYPAGLVPAKFGLLGKILVVIGVLGVLVMGISLLMRMGSIPVAVLYFGLAFIGLGSYLIFFVRDKE